MDTITSNPYAESFGSAFVPLMRKRWGAIILLVVLFLLGGIFYLHMATYVYGITMRVTPVPQQQAAAPGNLQNIANMVGLNLPSTSEQGSFQLYIDALLSRAIADEVAKDADLMRELYPESWSEAAGTWQNPNSMTRKVSDTVRMLLGVPVEPWQPPSGADLQDLLSRTITIQRTRVSPVITVSYLTAKPELGIRVLTALHNAADESLRRRMLQRTNGSIAYLKKELETATVADHREVLLRVLTEQERQRMLSSSNVSYVAEMFGQPVPSTRPVSPKVGVVLSVCFALALGATIGLLWLEYRLGFRTVRRHRDLRPA